MACEISNSAGSAESAGSPNCTCCTGAVQKPLGSAPAPHQCTEEKRLLIAPIEGQLLREATPLLREAYATGQPIFGEIRRTTTGAYLFAAVMDKQTARKIQRLLNPSAAEKGPAPAPGCPPA